MKFCPNCGKKLDSKQCDCKKNKIRKKEVLKNSFKIILEYLKNPNYAIDKNKDLHITVTIFLFFINMFVCFIYMIFRFEKNIMYNYYSSFQLNMFEKKKDIIDGTLLLNNNVDFINASTQVILYYILSIVAIIVVLYLIYNDKNKIREYINVLSINTIYITIAIIIMIIWANSNVYLILFSRIILIFSIIFSANSILYYEKIFKGRFSYLIGSGITSIYYIAILMLCLKVL